MNDMRVLLSRFYEDWPDSCFGPAKVVVGDHHYDDETILVYQDHIRRMMAYRLQIMTFPIETWPDNCTLAEMGATFELLDALLRIPLETRLAYTEQVQD